MDASFAALQPHLQALAYLAEIVIAEGLFLGHFQKRSRYLLRGVLPLVLLFLLAAVTGIPQTSSLARFLWYFLLMAWRVICALICFEGERSAIVSACVAGFATQHIANKATLLVRLIPAVEPALRRIPALGILLEVLVFVTVYGLIQAVFAKHIHPQSNNPHLDLLSATIVLLCIGVNRLVVDNAGESVQYEAAVCIYAIIGCIFALIIQVYISRWEEERSQTAVMQRLLADSEKQYEQWKATVELIQVAVHDLKHLLARVQALAEQKDLELPDLAHMRETVDNFTTAVHTGSDVLDVLLRSMTDLCRQSGVTLSCTVYTDYLKYFDGMGLYFLFANAIDNARESAALVPDPDKRLVDVSIRQFGSSAVIHIWNFYTGTLDFAGGLPVTRGDSRVHGFGMKSIELIVEQFGGVFSVRAESGVFNLDVMLPLDRPEAVGASPVLSASGGRTGSAP